MTHPEPHDTTATGGALDGTREVAGRLKVSTRTAQRLIKSGRLPAINVGSAARPRWRVTADDLAAFVNASRLDVAS